MSTATKAAWLPVVYGNTTAHTCRPLSDEVQLEVWIDTRGEPGVSLALRNAETFEVFADTNNTREWGRFTEHFPRTLWPRQIPVGQKFERKREPDAELQAIVDELLKEHDED